MKHSKGAGQLSRHIWTPPDVHRVYVLGQMSNAAWAQPRYEGWHMKPGMQRSGHGAVSFFSERKREAERDQTNATVMQGVSG